MSNLRGWEPCHGCEASRVDGVELDMVAKVPKPNEEKPYAREYMPYKRTHYFLRFLGRLEGKKKKGYE